MRANSECLEVNSTAYLGSHFLRKDKIRKRDYKNKVQEKLAADIADLI